MEPVKPDGAREALPRLPALGAALPPCCPAAAASPSAEDGSPVLLPSFSTIFAAATAPFVAAAAAPPPPPPQMQMQMQMQQQQPSSEKSRQWPLANSLAQALADTSFEAQRRQLGADELEVALMRAQRLVDAIRDIAAEQQKQQKPQQQPQQMTPQEALFLALREAKSIPVTPTSPQPPLSSAVVAQPVSIAGGSPTHSPPQMMLAAATSEEQQLVQPPRKRRGRPPGKKPEACSNCGATSTPEWRRGASLGENKWLPLCNACGLQLAKRKKSVTTTEQDPLLRRTSSIEAVLNL